MRNVMVLGWTTLLLFAVAPNKAFTPPSSAVAGSRFAGRVISLPPPKEQQQHHPHVLLAASTRADSSIVEELLHLVQTTKSRRASDIKTAEQRDRIQEILVELEQAGSNVDYLDSPDYIGDDDDGRRGGQLLWDNYELAYFDQSIDGEGKGRSDAYKNATRPFGIRSKVLGKLFSLRYSFQHAVPPNTLVNFVGFSFCGIPASVTSRGNYTRCTPEQVLEVFETSGTKLRQDTAICIDFEEPILAVGPRWGRLAIQMGSRAQSPPVTLCVPYMDDKLRLALVSKGGRLVFTRGGLANEPCADEWQDILQQTSNIKPLGIWELASAGVAATVPALRTPIQVAAAGSILLAIGTKVKGTKKKANNEKS